jgi:hypothetical protein
MPQRDVPQLPPGTKGLKRHAALVALSRDHHGVLVQALALRRAAQSSSPAAVRTALDAYLRFHAGEIRGHMADEEDVLLPLGGGADPAGAERIVAEHREIEALTTSLRETLTTGADPRATLHALGELLDDHVRFEERAFFTRVQERLDAGALERLGQALERHRAERGFAPSCPLPPRA